MTGTAHVELAQEGKQVTADKATKSREGGGNIMDSPFVLASHFLPEPPSACIQKLAGEGNWKM